MKIYNNPPRAAGEFHQALGFYINNVDRCPHCGSTGPFGHLWPDGVYTPEVQGGYWDFSRHVLSHEDVGKEEK